jgi:flagellar hook-length control protein FliK
VIAALGVSAAIDEKHVRGSGDSNVAATTATTDGSAGAGAAQAAASTASPSIDAPATAMKISAKVESSEFGLGLASQISTMLDRNITSAKLQVNPPALGPIEVRIEVQGDRAQVFMVSHSAVTRDALQSNTPTLRAMLGDQGFGQVSVDISQRSFQDRNPTAPSYEWTSDADRGNQPAAASTLGSLPRASSAVLDAYA